MPKGKMDHTVQFTHAGIEHEFDASFDWWYQSERAVRTLPNGDPGYPGSFDCEVVPTDETFVTGEIRRLTGLEDMKAVDLILEEIVEKAQDEFTEGDLISDYE